MSAISRARLWAKARFLVFDVETTRPPERGAPLRIVSIAGISVRNGQVVGRFVTDYVNPGCPIDEKSQKIHKISDALVAGAATFAAIAKPLMTLLHPDLSERTFFVAHNVSFDAPVLRNELDRVGERMPELPVLDTMALMSVAGVSGEGGRRSLKALCSTLGIDLSRHHLAASFDAEATAQALIELLNRAADQGHDDLDALLDLLGAHTTRSLTFIGRFADAEAPLEPEISAEHIATHATILPRRPGKRVLAGWLADTEKCSGLLCGGLVARVAVAEMPPADLLSHLLPRLRALATTAPAAQVATYLEAMLPLLPHLPPASRGRPAFARRTAALALETDLGRLLDPLGRCTGPTSCPACRRGDPCPLDVWRLALAELLIGSGSGRKGRRTGFVSVGPGRLEGAYASLVRGRHHHIADLALRLVHRQWISVGQRDRAGQLVREALAAGCADPEIIGTHAAHIGRRGTPEALAEAIAICDAALEHRDGSTDEAWSALEARRSQLRSRAARFRVRYEDERDEEGNLVPKRLHHPAAPLRRPPRFQPRAA